MSLAAAAAATFHSGLLSAAPRTKAYITPEQFGAVGDGVTNDTAAFAAMTSYVNRRRGGDIALRPTTYIVGAQAPDPLAGYSFGPVDIMHFQGCSKPLSIAGNGARLRCANGLRFGTFDPATGQPTYHSMPYTASGERASPYRAMIMAEGCSGGIDIRDIELDGNLGRLWIGGQYGDTGWQLPACGLWLGANACNEQVTNVYSHHHALDGVYIDGVADRISLSTLQQVVSEYNARQGCSIVGGRNYAFANCRFNHTGKAGLMSAPGAGVDIEAEVKPIRDLSFLSCEFSNNTGVGMVADSGDSEGARFDGCRFVGTITWSAWPYKPHFRFANCQFVGAVVHAFPDQDPDRATQFINCAFLDDPTLSPTGQVYGPSQSIVNLAESVNVLFDGCRFDLQKESLLPWSWNAIYNNCTMSQVSTDLAHPKGTYTGICRIDGNIELYGAIILGDLTVNGQLMPRTG